MFASVSVCVCVYVHAARKIVNVRVPCRKTEDRQTHTHTLNHRLTVLEALQILKFQIKISNLQKRNPSSN